MHLTERRRKVSIFQELKPFFLSLSPCGLSLLQALEVAMLDQRVRVLVGDNDSQWEVRFSREVYRRTGISCLLVPAITVEVSAGGEVEHYAWGEGPENAAERMLFDECADDIRVALAARGVTVFQGGEGMGLH